MDIVQEYAVSALHLYNTADPYLRPIRRFIYTTQAKAYPLMLPYLNHAAVLAKNSPAILTVGVLLLFLLVAMQILNFVRRIMMFWVRVVYRLVFWGGLATLIAVVAQRGMERSVGDLMDWGRELSEVWWREYRRWEGYQKMQQQSQGTGYGMENGNGRAGWR